MTAPGQVRKGIGDGAMIKGPLDPTAELALGDPLGQGINRDGRKGLAAASQFRERLPLGGLDRGAIRRPLDGAPRDDALSRRLPEGAWDPVLAFPR